ncbi:CAAX prenyl protease 2 isoform X6 [Patagioenas fasciata]|uniref:CAAX prenyl protease 2 isoform X6 n=1 Tax=Patagioenas fasciata TaxID=372321 RepID=UPI003A9A5DD6
MLWPRPHALDHAPMPWPRPLSTPQRWPRSVSPWPRPCPSPIRCLRPDSSPFSWPRPLGGPAPGAMAVSEPAGSSWAAPGRAGSVPGSEPGPPGAPGAPGAGCGPGPCWAAVLACLSLACCYVGSLYVWGSPLPRDHPSVIKRRFTSVLLVSGLAPALVWLWREHSGIKAEWSLPALLGLRLEGLLPATLLPLLLTMILFLGPLIQLSMDCSWRWSHGLRAALAHFHHVIEQLRFRQGSLGSILVAAAFQFSYTAVFGAYTAFIFLRTGHLAGPVVCHSFCNALGFPALGAALGHPRRGALLPCYLGGVLLFLLLLRPLTHPPLFGGGPPEAPPPACS